MPDGKKIGVEYVATLARLALTAEETAAFESQLGDVLHYIDKLREVDVRDAEPAAPMLDVFRADEPRDWFTTEDALRNAPRHVNDLFIVTKVVE